MFGEFGARIDKNEKNNLENSKIGDEIDGRFYVSEFHLK
jgi:hypothetical protein